MNGVQDRICKTTIFEEMQINVNPKEEDDVASYHTYITGLDGMSAAGF